MQLHQSEKTIKFVNEVNNLVESGEVKSFAIIAEAIKMPTSMLSNIRNGRASVPNLKYKLFCEVYNSKLLSEIEVKKDRVEEDNQVAVSIHTLIESNRMLVETNKDLTGMLKQSYSNKVSSSSDQHISGTLLPYLQQIALAGVGRFWKDENVGIVELNKILLSQVKTEVKLGK